MQRPRRSQEPEPRGADWWDSLESFWQDKSLGAASKLCYAWLWRRIGGRPGNATVTYGLLGATFGKSGQAAYKWVQHLVDRGLVEIVHHDDKAGVLELYVEEAGQMVRPRRTDPDPQKQLPGFAGEDSADGHVQSVDTIPIDAASSNLSPSKGSSLCSEKGSPGQGIPPHAPAPTRFDRPTDRPVDREEVDWIEVQRRSIKAARYVPIKPGKAARRDAEGLLAAAVLSLTRLPESCFADAVNATRKKTDTRNAAAYFRRCFGEEAAKHLGRPGKEGPQILSELERLQPIPPAQVGKLLGAIRQSPNGTPPPGSSAPPVPQLADATPEQLADARQAVGGILDNLRSNKSNFAEHPKPKPK